MMFWELYSSAALTISIVIFISALSLLNKAKQTRKANTKITMGSLCGDRPHIIDVKIEKAIDVAASDIEAIHALLVKLDPIDNCESWQIVCENGLIKFFRIPNAMRLSIEILAKPHRNDSNDSREVSGI